MQIGVGSSDKIKGTLRRSLFGKWAAPTRPDPRAGDLRI